MVNVNDIFPSPLNSLNTTDSRWNQFVQTLDRISENQSSVKRDTLVKGDANLFDHRRLTSQLVNVNDIFPSPLNSVPIDNGLKMTHPHSLFLWKAKSNVGTFFWQTFIESLSNSQRDRLLLDVLCNGLGSLDYAKRLVANSEVPDPD